MAGMFDFLANDPTGTDGYNAMEMRRKIAMQLMGQQKKYPKNIGEGLSAIGDSIGEIGMMRALMRQQGALDASRNRTMATPPPDVLPSPTSPRAEAEPTPDVVASARPDDIPAAPTRTAQAEPGVEDGGYNFIDAQAGGRFKPTPGYLQDAIAAREPDPDMQAYYGGLSGQEAPKGARDVSPTGAAGPYQFTRGTGARYGIPGDARFDPGASTDAVRKFTADNAAKFEATNGRPPTFQELAVMHQQGAKGGIDLMAGRAAPAGNLAVNNMAGFSPQAAVAKMNRFYGMPSEAAPVGRDAIAATLAGRPPSGPPDAQDARLAEVTGMSRGPTGAYAYAPTASRSGDIVSDAPGITGISPKVGAAAADTLQQQARPPAPEVPQVNPTLPTPLTASTAGSPPEAAGNRPIMTDIKPQPAPAPGAQMAQFVPPEIAPRAPKSAQPPDPVVVPPTSAPLPNQAPGVYNDPTPPKKPDPEQRSPVEADFEQKSLREQDPVLQRWYAGQAAIRAEARKSRDALNTKEYESQLAQNNSLLLARQAAQRDLPMTQQQLIEQKYKVQQQAEQDQQRALFGNLPAHVHSYLEEGKKNAQSAVGSLEGLRNAKEAMDAGTIFGIDAPVKLAYYRVRAAAGDKDAARIVAATQTFTTSLGPAAAQAIRAYGGAQISNTDRQFGMQMSGADISNDEKSARRMIDIGERSAKAAVKEHRDNLDIMLKDIPPRVRRMYDVPDPMPGVPAEKAATSHEFKSVQEAEQANLPKGTKITIGGKKFKVQ